LPAATSSDDTITPNTDPMPPTATIESTEMDAMNPKSSGIRKRAKYVYNPPATPAMAVPMAKATSL